MKKYFKATICLLLPLLLLTGCSQEETPYDRYLAAREKLLNTESVTIERNEDVITLGTDVSAPDNQNGYQINGRSLIHFAKGQQSDMFTFEDFSTTETRYPPKKETSHTMSYFKDNCLYMEDFDDSTPNYCQQKAPQKDFAIHTVIMDIQDFPLSAVASQTSQQTEEGEEISFVLDCEKYYQYCYASIYKDYPYGSAFTYREPPVFTVFLDKEGYLIKASGSNYTVNTNGNSETGRSFSITFSDYNATTPDFSGLIPENYMVLDN